MKRALALNAFCQQIYRLIPDLKRTRASYPTRPFGYVGVELAAADLQTA